MLGWKWRVFYEIIIKRHSGGGKMIPHLLQKRSEKCWQRTGFYEIQVWKHPNNTKPTLISWSPTAPSVLAFGFHLSPSSLGSNRVSRPPDSSIEFRKGLLHEAVTMISLLHLVKLVLRKKSSVRTFEIIGPSWVNERIEKKRKVETKAIEVEIQEACASSSKERSSMRACSLYPSRSLLNDRNLWAKLIQDLHGLFGTTCTR